MYRKADLQFWESFNSQYKLKIDQIAKYTFGITEFRDNQKSIIKCILENNDTFILMRSGGGKSLTFQIPALLTSGVSFVIMPLLSLIYDQISTLKSLGINAEEYQKIDTNTQFENLPKMIFITPEKLYQSEDAINFVKKLYNNKQIDRFIIDEAHCVALWGNSFRKSYLELSKLKTNYPNVPIVALTATATEQLKSDIIATLNMKNPFLFQTSFNRPNLLYDVRKRENNQEALKEIAYLAKQKYKNQSGIVYCCTKAQTTEVCKQLVQQYNISCDIYHASINDQVRKNTQDQWMQNKIQILIATIALGMGIDKPDVRFVVHFTMSSSLEHYQQESGRAGRDGKPADCVLYYNQKDKSTILNIISVQGSQFLGEIKAEIFLMTKVINYCENDVVCKRKLLINYMGEEFDQKDCNNGCIVCQNQNRNSVVESLNIYDDVVALLDELDRFYNNNNSNNYVTKIQLVDYLAGQYIEEKKKKLLQNLNLSEIFKKFEKDKLSKILNQLQNDAYIFEERKQFNYQQNFGGFKPTFSILKVNQIKLRELKQNQEKIYQFKFNKNKLIMQTIRTQENYNYETLKERNYAVMPQNLLKNTSSNSKVMVPTYLKQKTTISDVNCSKQNQQSQIKFNQQFQQDYQTNNNNIINNNNEKQNYRNIQQNDNNLKEQNENNIKEYNDNNLKDQLDSILQLDVSTFFKETESQNEVLIQNQNQNIIQKRKSFQDSYQELQSRNNSNLLLQHSLDTGKSIFNENTGFCNMMQFEILLEKLKKERQQLFDNFVEKCLEKEELDKLIDIDDFISLKSLKLIIKYLIEDEIQYLKICQKENLSYLNKNYDSNLNFILDNIENFLNVIVQFQKENEIDKKNYISLEDIDKGQGFQSLQQQIQQFSNKAEEEELDNQENQQIIKNIQTQSKIMIPQIEEDEQFQQLFEQYKNIENDQANDDDSLFLSNQIKQKRVETENSDE